jgi:hypothetical protein
VPIGATWNKVMLGMVPFSVIKGTTRLRAAMTALAYAFTPQQMCDLVNEVGYGVPLDESCLNDFGRQWAVTAEHRAMGIPGDEKWYQENYPRLLDQFNGWLTK